MLKFRRIGCSNSGDFQCATAIPRYPIFRNGSKCLSWDYTTWVSRGYLGDSANAGASISASDDVRNGNMENECPRQYRMFPDRTADCSAGRLANRPFGWTWLGMAIQRFEIPSPLSGRLAHMAGLWTCWTNTHAQNRQFICQDLPFCHRAPENAPPVGTPKCTTLCCW